MVLFDPAFFDPAIFDTDELTYYVYSGSGRGIPINAYKQFKYIDKQGNTYYSPNHHKGC